MKAIEVEHLTFSYDGQKLILNDISFSIEQGEFVAIIGDSGCGKSTLCHILCGIIPAAIGGEISGRAVVGGRLLSEVKLKDMAKTVGFVMQDPDRQIVTSAVEDELAFGPENLCIAPKEIKKTVDETLEFLQLKKLRLCNPNKLSGGQKQLVTIGSVLTLEPSIVIMDEPFSHLDSSGRERAAAVVDNLKKASKTVIAVEHDHSTISRADRWLLLENGRIKADGKPREVVKYL